MIVFFKRKLCLLFFSIATVQTINAQQNNYNSLPMLIDSAVKNFPQLLQKQALVNSSRANVIDVKHSFIPTLNVSDEINVASANQLPGTSLPLEIIPSISGANRASNNWQPAATNIGVLYSEYLLADFGLKN